mgnify:CR=1 FL=1
MDWRHTLISITALAVLLSGPFWDLCEGYMDYNNDSMQLIVLVEDRKYSTGDWVNITVHVYLDGSHSDSDQPPVVSFGSYPYRTLNTTKQETGIYRATTILSETDISGSMVEIGSSATMRKENETDTEFYMAQDFFRFAISDNELSVYLEVISISDRYLKPGTSVSMRGKALWNGSPFDPETIGFSAVYIDGAGQNNVNNIEENGVSTGVFDLDWTVPSMDNVNQYTIRMEAKHSGIDSSTQVVLRYDPFYIVYHNISKRISSESTPGKFETTFDLFIFDTNGEPVQGANVSLFFTENNDPFHQTPIPSVITDSEGKARIIVEHTQNAALLNVQGKASHKGVSQELFGTVKILSSTGGVADPFPINSLFQALPLWNPNEVLPVGERHSLEYTVFQNNQPYTESPVYLYLVRTEQRGTPTSSGRIQTESEEFILQTDEDGKLSFEFEAADEPCQYYAYFKAPTMENNPLHYGHQTPDGKNSEVHLEMFFTAQMEYSGPILDLEISGVVPGTPTSVKAEASEEGADSMKCVVYTPIENENDDIHPYWDVQWAIWICPELFLQKEEGDYFGELTLPSILDEESGFKFLVSTVGGESVFQGSTPYLKNGEGWKDGIITNGSSTVNSGDDDDSGDIDDDTDDDNVSDNDENDLPILPILIGAVIVVLIAVLVFIIFAIKGKGRKNKEIESGIEENDNILNEEGENGKEE